MLSFTDSHSWNGIILYEWLSSEKMGLTLKNGSAVILVLPTTWTEAIISSKRFLRIAHEMLSLCTSLRAILGLLSYCQYIRNFSQIAAPLYNLFSTSVGAIKSKKTWNKNETDEKVVRKTSVLAWETFGSCSEATNTCLSWLQQTFCLTHKRI